eukprot:TRINITY_DN3352_c0_g1_i1.p1 TRINITY_DN3352_c0_g1~~TRINITY_DN3352_c0_g1_i1.p1  ORF type:complete len:311 (-),score=4.36 TRINITY_DN3352_c0_g1_i1:343-1275(-)
MAASSLHWQPELHLVQAVKASAAALEQVLVASAQGDGKTPAGPSKPALEVKSLLRAVKGACSALQSACTVACRTLSDKVKMIQRGNATEGCSELLARSSAQENGNGSQAHGIVSSGDLAFSTFVSLNAPKPSVVLAPTMSDGSGLSKEVTEVGLVDEPLGKMRGRRQRRSKKHAAEREVEEGGLECDKSFVDAGTQTEVTGISETEGEYGGVQTRRSERLREKAENEGFLTDRISGLSDRQEFHQRARIMTDAWKAYEFRHGVSMVQYLKIAGLVCEGYLTEGPGFSHRDQKGWSEWESFVKEAELQKYG